MVKKNPAASPIPFERIRHSIFEIRGHKVMLDSELAALYGVETKILNRTVRRNLDRFPEDFMFQLSAQEVANLRIQFGTSSEAWGGRRYRPFVFTEHGILMLSSVLHSDRAAKVNIAIMRAFNRMREFMLSHEELSAKLQALERRYDAQFKVVFNSIRELINAKPKDVIEVPSRKRPLGFRKRE